MSKLAPPVEPWVPECLARISSGECFLGTGVLIRADLILTCCHVVIPPSAMKPRPNLRVNLDGDKPISATLLHRDRERDLALLRLRRAVTGIEPPSWDARADLKGHQVWVSGFPKNQAYNAERKVTADDEFRIVFDEDLQEGISGGIARFTNKRWQPGWCAVGLLQKSIELLASGAIPLPIIERFLSEHDIPLRLDPPPRRVAVPASAAALKKYREYVHKLTECIDPPRPRGISRDIMPEEVKLDQIHIPPQVVSAEIRAEKERATRPSTHSLLSEVHRHRVLLVDGDAGSGKSTFLKSVAQAMLRGKAPERGTPARYTGLPLWLPIRSLETYLAERFPNGMPPTFNLAWIPDYFAKESLTGRWELSEDFFRAALHDPANLLLVDGLDEARSTLTVNLFAALADSCGCGIALTLRPEAESSGRLLPKIKARVSLPELSPEEIKRFVENWTGMVRGHNEASARKHGAALLHNVTAGPLAVRRMGRNPLMLTLLAMITSSRPEYRLPEQRAELYELVVNWLAESQQHEEYRPNQFLGHLSELALHMTAKDRWEIGFGDAQKHLAKHMRIDTEAAGRFLYAAEERTRIIAIRANHVSFWHRGFQEFLAARRIAHLPDLLEQARKFLADQRSPEVLRLLAGFLHFKAFDEHLESLFAAVVQSAQPRLEREAWVAGMAGSMLADLSAPGYRLAPATEKQYETLRGKVSEMFTVEGAAKVAVQTRAAAADALALAGDSRLHLPKADLDPDWREYWVKVPGDKFWIGSQKHTPGRADYDPEMYDDEDWRRSEPLAVKEFWMGRHPVTVYEYREYLEREEKKPHPGMKFDEQSEHPGRPVVRVTWEEARDYCRWAGGGLPTEKQWEFAARGPNNWKYPWGNGFPEQDAAVLANCMHVNLGAPTPVGLFPAGAQNETGILDLAGNVWEWTSSFYHGSGGNRVVRGGSFDGYAGSCGPRIAVSVPPDVRFNNFGFRCLREVFP